MVQSVDNLKWKRLGKGKYMAATNCGRIVFVERICSYWCTNLQGGYAIKNTENHTLAYAKANVGKLMPQLVENFEKKQAKESAERLIQSEKVRAEETRKRALSAPVYDPTAGVSWFDWAECFVGCTAAAVRGMDTGRNKRWRRFLKGCN